jgi:hypothetical protein
MPRDGMAHALTRTRDHQLGDLLLGIFWLSIPVGLIIAFNVWIGLLGQHLGQRNPQAEAKALRRLAARSLSRGAGSAIWRSAAR